MTTTIILISRYVLIALSMIFTISVIHSMTKSRVRDSRFVRKNNRNHYNYRIQKCTIYLIHTLLFAIMYLYTHNFKLIILYICQMVFFIILQLIIEFFFEDFNKTLINIMIFMFSIGLVMNTRLAFDKCVKQFIICVVASFICLIIQIIMEKSKKIREFYYLFGFLGVIALFLVYYYAKYTYGAKMALDFGVISVQPAEFVKISFVIFLSGILYKYRGIKAVTISAFVLAVHVVILILCKDLGTAMILFTVYLFMIYMSTGRFVLFGGGLIIGGLSGAIAYSIFDHVKARISAWIDPWSIIDGKGYQITQSLFSICAGGLLGSGLMLGKPTKIPIVEQDFIFSAICEELGGIIGIIILILSVCIIYIAMNISKMCKDEFYKYTTASLAIIYGLQIFLTVGGAIKLIPSTGVTYPLLSNGGSSLFATIAVIYILQGVKLNEKIDD